MSRDALDEARRNLYRWEQLQRERENVKAVMHLATLFYIGVTAITLAHDVAQLIEKVQRRKAKARL